MRNRFLLFLLVPLLLMACEPVLSPKTTVASPDGNLEVTISTSPSNTHYLASFDGKPIVLPSTLGFEFRGEPAWGNQLEIETIEEEMVDEQWEPVWGTTAKIRNHYQVARLTLREKKGAKRAVDVVCRVYNDGFAFRYQFPETDWPDSLFITNELTQFQLAGNPIAWHIPADFDSYEKNYTRSQLSEVETANTPITLKTEEGVHLSIHEAQLRNYPGMTLKRDSAGVLAADLVPWPDGDKAKIKVGTGFETPWRTVQVSRTAGDLMTAHLIQNLNEPNALNETDWIEPMKYVGIWWGMHIGTKTWAKTERHGATTENMRTYIDFAAAHNIKGVLAEGWNTGWENWGQAGAFDYVTPYADFDLEELAAYANEKDVELIGHLETGGDIPTFEAQLEAAFAQFERLGIHAVKTGYAGGIRPEGQHHHGQMMVQHYQKVLEQAAKYQIMLDVHEPIKPTGLDRTYPNMMTREGVKGMEWNAWSEGNSPEHTTILPFTRGLAGPIDYTPGIFDLQYAQFAKDRVIWNQGTPTDARVHTTLAKQLALYVVLYSPMQMAADLVENYENQPAFQFIEAVPVEWEETQVLQAEIGEYVSVARRSGDTWFVGSITDEKPRYFSVPLAQLGLDSAKNYRITVYEDGLKTDLEGNPTEISIATYRVSGDASVPMALAGGGGQALIIRPDIPETEKPLPLAADWEQNAKERMESYRSRQSLDVELPVQHSALKSTIALQSAYHTQYSGGGPQALVDGKLAKAFYKDPNWQGYYGNSLEAVIDLGEEKTLNTVTLRFLQDQKDWIFGPLLLMVGSSSDGVQFKMESVTPIEGPIQSEEVKVVEQVISLFGVKTQYLQVKAGGVGTCPDWHSGKGEPAWLFIDEIIVE